MKKIILLVLFQSMFFPVLAISHADDSQAKRIEHFAVQQFEQLKGLKGKWVKAQNKSPDFYIEFELTANDSVVVEKWLRKDKLHSMTVYHRDSQKIIATHYCPQGNQPRLESVLRDNSNRLHFQFKDATNLDKSKQSYQVELALVLNAGKDELIRSETYQNQQQTESSKLDLIRKTL